jgi:hypothetical protein
MTPLLQRGATSKVSMTGPNRCRGVVQ